MPHYFFNVYDGFSGIDGDGTPLPDLKTARRIALRHAGELLDDQAHRDPLGEGWRLEVVDETGRVVFGLDVRLTDPPVGRDANRVERPIAPDAAGLDVIAGPHSRHVGE